VLPPREEGDRHVQIMLSGFGGTVAHNPDRIAHGRQDGAAPRRQFHAHSSQRRRGARAGDDQASHDAAGLALAMFNGLLFLVMLGPGLAIDSERMERVQARLLRVLAQGPA
jgi:hypothetical protein